MSFMDASWVSVFIISFTLFFTTIYWFYILAFAKAKLLALITVVLASLTMTLVFFDVISSLAELGGVVILALWTLPSLLVWNFRKYFTGLTQRKLIGLQIFRLIGGCFLIEMTRGFIPASFALPAGIGDIIVGSVAAILFISYRHTPRWGVILVTAIGLLDFACAFFFGFTSQPGPAQLFAFGAVNHVNLFPTGMIPIFLVPYALVNHVLSMINLQDKKALA